MKAVVFQEPRELTVETVDNPELERGTDALIRVTSSAICGTDLHVYEGRTGKPSGKMTSCCSPRRVEPREPARSARGAGRAGPSLDD